jgi:hypothetical protein
MMVCPVMKKLTEDLKRMLAGLASQDAGDFLPLEQKMQVIHSGASSSKPAAPVAGMQAPSPVPRRIAVLVKRGDPGEALAYALEACCRLNAQLDVLYHGPMGTAGMAGLKVRLQHAGVTYRHIDLPEPAVSGIEDYIYNHLSLIYLVAAADDPVVTRLVEETLPTRRKPLPVPLVLIEGKPANGFATAAAL